MDIVLGVSMTPTTVRMVLVEGREGRRGDRRPRLVRHRRRRKAQQTLPPPIRSSRRCWAPRRAPRRAAITSRRSASPGVTTAEAAALRDALAAKGIDDVMLVSAGHAAAALAQAVGRAVGYDTTALLFIDRDTATLSVVQTDDGSVVKVLSRSLHSDDAMGVLTEMAAAVDAQDAPPQGMFVVGSGVDVTSVKATPAASGQPSGQRAGRARTRARSRCGSGCCQRAGAGGVHRRPGLLAGPRRNHRRRGLSPASPTPRRSWGRSAPMVRRSATTSRKPTCSRPEGERKPFLLVGSALTSIFVVGVVALVISLAVSIRPTADQRPSPGQSALVPSTVAPAAPAPPPAPEAQPIEAPPPPPAQTIKPPVPVVQQAPQAPPRTVYVEAPPPASGGAASRAALRRPPPRHRFPRPIPAPVVQPAAGLQPAAALPAVDSRRGGRPICRRGRRGAAVLRRRSETPQDPQQPQPQYPQQPQHRRFRSSRSSSTRSRRRRTARVERLRFARWFSMTRGSVGTRVPDRVGPRRRRWRGQLLPDLLQRWLARPRSLVTCCWCAAKCRVAVSSSRLPKEVVCDAPSSARAISVRPMPPEWPNSGTT